MSVYIYVYMIFTYTAELAISNQVAKACPWYPGAQSQRRSAEEGM